MNITFASQEPPGARKVLSSILSRDIFAFLAFWLNFLGEAGEWLCSSRRFTGHALLGKSNGRGEWWLLRVPCSLGKKGLGSAARALGWAAGRAAAFGGGVNVSYLHRNELRARGFRRAWNSRYWFLPLAASQIPWRRARARHRRRSPLQVCDGVQRTLPPHVFFASSFDPGV